MQHLVLKAVIALLGATEGCIFRYKGVSSHVDSYRDLSPKQIYRIQQDEKKRKYNSRVTEIEQGTFTPLVFTTTGGMADECLRYHSRLAELLSAKKQESYATAISWVRAKVSFAILRSVLLCLRGSRTPEKDRDLETEKGQAGLPQTQQL